MPSDTPSPAAVDAAEIARRCFNMSSPTQRAMLFDDWARELGWPSLSALLEGAKAWKGVLATEAEMAKLAHELCPEPGRLAAEGGRE